MLSTPEKLLFLAASLATAFLAHKAIRRLVRIIARGHGRPDWRQVPHRMVRVVLRTASFSTVFRARLGTSLLHSLVGWGFAYYLLVNLADLLEGYLPGFAFLGQGPVADGYRLGGDILSVGIMTGMAFLLMRRFVLRSPALTARPEILLQPRTRAGIRRDSAIVGSFILLHVGARFLGQSLAIAQAGPDRWQPFASAVAGLWHPWSPAALEAGRHLAWWVALGTILAFIPYFPYTKHIHLFIGPLNFLLKPGRPSIGQLDALDFQDQSVEQFGAWHMEDLSWSAFMDAFACIMCYRCQEACPAYATGKILSPAALEINKRYFLNREGSLLASGGSSSQALTEFAIPPEAVWACTACGACVDICPVGNEPMRDILEIRRHLVLMENAFPGTLQAVYRGMERSANPWSLGPETRLRWADGLDIPTVSQLPHPELLWWVGCAPATDPRAQQTAQALARILKTAGVQFAVLGPEERCTGDAARRSGNEYLFAELASANVETLNRVAAKRIVTTCPHCLHTLKNEYPAFGGRYTVIHHTELIQELLQTGRLKFKAGLEREGITFHDPCYLGRHNTVFEPPRTSLSSAGMKLSEMPRNRRKSFCCGAGGAQMWKEEEHGDERVSQNRLREAEATGASTLAVGCPFCMIMLSDAASREAAKAMQVKDVAEIVADRLAPWTPTHPDH